MTQPLLPARLKSLLARSRLRLNTALPQGGQGDRSSRARGAGLEFAEHRPYQPGDDLKHIDPHLEARLGETFIRQYSVDAQLPVTILIDSSASMATGEPDKLRFGSELAAALSYLALSGNDRVRLAALQNGQALFTGWFSGVRNTERIVQWLNGLTAQGHAELEAAALSVAGKLPATGLVIIISDWQAEQAARLPLLLGGEGREVICVHVFAPAEADPGQLGNAGDLRIVDSETGEELDVAVNPQALSEYREAWQRFSNGLRDGMLSQRALYMPLNTAADLEAVLLKDWTRLGLILR